MLSIVAILKEAVRQNREGYTVLRHFYSFPLLPMVDTMNIAGWDYGFIVLWGLHVLSVVAFFTGFLFLVVLAIKTFTPKQLKSWALWLMAAGTIACLFTIALTGRLWMGHRYRAGMDGRQIQKMEQVMEMMKEHEGGADEEENGEHEEMMEMMRMMMGKSGPLR